MPFLSEARIRAAKPADKPYKLFDERGLYLKVETSGSRLWRFKYRHGGKEKLLAVLRRLEKRGKHETAHRTKQRCGQVFRYAIATGRATRDISADLRDTFPRLVDRIQVTIRHTDLSTPMLNR